MTRIAMTRIATSRIATSRASRPAITPRTTMRHFVEGTDAPLRVADVIGRTPDANEPDLALSRRARGVLASALVCSLVAFTASLMLASSAGAADGSGASEAPVLAQSRPPRGPGGRPPREAVEACANLAREVACSFSTPRGGTVPGTCRAMPNETPSDATAVCVPTDHEARQNAGRG